MFSLLWGLADLLVRISSLLKENTFEWVSFKSFFGTKHLVYMGIQCLCFFHITGYIVVYFSSLDALRFITTLISLSEDHSLFE